MQIYIYDGQNPVMTPEDLAMLQALYSRDPKSVTVHLAKVKEKGPGKFMSQFYVGYGHKSIGDCGSTTIFIENVSLLAAKAIQDWPLYSGQEASTRYLDMSAQEVLNPLGTIEGEEIQKAWLSFYQKVLARLIDYLPTRFPKKDNQDENIYKKAIKAKAFDVARGFLPAGITTLLSWHTNLRQAADHLKELHHHPLPEVKKLAENILVCLRQKYPASFSHKSRPEEETYLKKTIPAVTYYDFDAKSFAATAFLNENKIKQYLNVLKNRPLGSELPKQLRICGHIAFEFLIDFGSFRDFQRQRSVVQTMPLLTTKRGFHPWYLSELPPDLQTEAVGILAEQEHLIGRLPATAEIKQYYIGLGYLVACQVFAPLPAAVYIAELRSQQTVHPTLREVAKALGRAIEKYVPGIALYCDYGDSEWSEKRGREDIIQKEK